MNTKTTAKIILMILLSIGSAQAATLECKSPKGAIPIQAASKEFRDSVQIHPAEPCYSLKSFALELSGAVCVTGEKISAVSIIWKSTENGEFGLEKVRHKVARKFASTETASLLIDGYTVVCKVQP